MRFLPATAAFLVNLIWPPRCAGCNVLLSHDARPFCATCEACVVAATPACSGCAGPADDPGETQPGRWPFCSSCRAHPPPFSRAFAAALYGGVVADTLLAWKHGGRRHLARPLALLLAPAFAAACALSVDAVLPVPLHPRRLRQRGFNQSLDLLRAARAIARTSARSIAVSPARSLEGPVVQARPVDDVPLLVDALRRVRDTPTLGHEPPSRRRAHVRDAFAVARPRLVQGRKLLVVDDVMTTGATLAECARALRRGGAADVSVLALARAWPDAGP